MEILKENTFEVVLSAVRKLVDLVKPTFGPAEDKVLMSKGGVVTCLDDGSQIAKDIEFEDEAENAVLKIIRNVALRTNEEVGDSTTASLLMLGAIFEELAKSPFSSRDVIKELRKGLKEAIEQLRSNTRPIKTKKDLEKVALTSFNNPEIASLLAETVFKIGKNGVIDIQPFIGLRTEIELADGFSIGSGFASDLMATEKDVAIYENINVLVTDKSFNFGHEVVDIINICLEKKIKSLVVFCKDIAKEGIMNVVLNKNVFKMLVVKVPDGEYEDIALLTGANSIMDEKGNKEITVEDFGKAKRIVSRLTETKLIGGKGSKEEIKTVVDYLSAKIANNEDKITSARRLARLTGSIVQIKVGADTDDEAKAVKFKVEDASNATLTALNGGAVIGGGFTLASLKTTSPLLNAALKYPQNQLIENIGEFEANDNILDPTEALIAGLVCAVSITTLLVSLKRIAYDKLAKPK